MNEHNLVPNIRFNGFEDEWKKSELKEIAKIVGGGTPDTNNSSYWHGNINWYSPNEIGKYPYVYSSHKKITNLGLKKSSAKLHPSEKTILFTSRAGIGDMAILKTEAATNQGFQSLELKDNIYPYFVYSYGFKIKKEAIRVASGSTFLEISKKDIEKINLWFPSIKEQQKIGDFFSKLDKLLDLQKQKIDKLELLKKALLQKLFPKHDAKIPELRFKGYKDDWIDRKFVHCLTKIIDFRGKTPKKLGLSWSNNGKYRALSAINVKNGFIDKNIDVHFGNYDLYKKWMGKTELEKGDILFTTEAPMGNIAIINDNDKYILSQRTIAFRVDEKNINSRFLLYRLNTVSAKNKLMSLSTGGTAQGISQKNLSYLFISISNSIDEQKRIGNILAKVDHLIYLENKKLHNLQQVKKCLLQNMFVE